MTAFAKNLTAILDSHGAGSRRDLAEALGVTPAFITQLCNGTRSPSVARLYAIAAYLRVSTDSLLGTR